jgi:hypothetical protein
MEILKLIAAFGIGAILAKVIDAAWIQPFLAKKQTHSWTREKRLEAFTDLSRNLLAFSLDGKENRTPFENFAIAARAILLIDDEGLVTKIDQHIAERDRLFRVTDGGEKLPNGKTVEDLYNSLYKEARDIIRDLKVELRNNKT